MITMTNFQELQLNKKIFFFIIIFSLFSYCSNTRNNKLNQEFDKQTNKRVYEYAEIMPIYKNGLGDFQKDFINNLNYNGTYQSKIVLQFVIDKKGFLIGERIFNKNEKDLTPFEINCLKSLKKIQNWKPGKINNKNVSVIMKIPIHINLNFD